MLNSRETENVQRGAMNIFVLFILAMLGSTKQFWHKEKRHETFNLLRGM